MFYSNYEYWMLAQAIISASDRKLAKLTKELDRAEINAAYKF